MTDLERALTAETKVKELEARCARLRYALEAYEPPMPPMLEGETDEEYTNRLTGADGTGRSPYAERRFRECSLGYHDNCSDPEGEECECPCHQFPRLRRQALDAEAGMSGLLKVWLVTAEDECGDGVEVVRAFATKELAEQYIERFGSSRHFQEPWEWEVDTVCPEARTAFIPWLDMNGKLIDEQTDMLDHDEHEAWEQSDSVHSRLVTACSTKGREEALKLAQERVTELKATKEESGQ